MSLNDADDLSFDKLPRMADFCVWAEAGLVELGWERGVFLHAFGESHKRGHAAAIDSVIIGPALVEIAKNGGFEGTASQLKLQLEAIVDEKLSKSREWPKTAAVLAKQVRRLAPDLRGLGLRIEEGDARARTPWTIGKA